MRRFFAIAFLALLVAAPARTQSAKCSDIAQNIQKDPNSATLAERYVCKLADDVNQRKARPLAAGAVSGPQAGLVLANDSQSIFVLLVAETFYPSYLVQIEDSRLDKQVGGSDANSGSTSLVAKGSVPAILGFAVENGALTRTESGTTITFRGNPVGILDALRQRGFVQSYDSDAAETRFLRRLSFAVSFDTERGAMPGVLAGDAQQVSAYSFRFDLLNQRDPRHRVYRKDWGQLVQTVQSSFAQTWSDTVDALIEQRSKWKDPALQQWFDETQRLLATAQPGEVEGVLRKQFAALPKDDLTVETKGKLQQFGQALSDLLRARQDILERVSKGLIVTFEYTNNREIDAPDLSNFKLIAEGALWGGRADLTANASFTISNSIPSGTNLRRVRDFQFSGQMDIPLGNVQKRGPFVLSFSGKYERMREDAMMGGIMVPNTKGDVGIGQLKLTIPVKGTGVKIPISLTFANRTELIKEKEVRGNFGLTFDLDAIFARLNP